MAKKEPQFVYLVLSAEDEYVGMFKDLRSISRYMEEEAIEEIQVFKVTEALDASYPPEPEPEFDKKKLSNLNAK